MAMLEDFFFKHDVYKDKDSDEIGPNARAVNSDSEASDEECNAPKSAADPASAWIRKDLPEQMKNLKVMQCERSTKTGPKGVINDYKEYKRQKAIQRERNDLIRQARMMRIAQGYVAPADTAGQDPSPPGNNNDDEDVFDDPDDEFMAQYRHQRLEQLKQMDSRPIYGEFRYVSPEQYVDLVNDADTRTKVVVHLYEPFLGTCQTVNQHLTTLAKRYPRVLFLAVESNKADPNIDHTKLPLLLIYGGGDLIHSILNLSQLVEGQFTLENIEWVLEEHQVMDVSLKKQ